MPEPELLPVSDAATLCGIAPRTLARWSKEGAAPKPIRLGFGTRASVRYRRSDLLNWIEAGCPCLSEMNAAEGGTR
jgi:predicted DNA-binding transcriptional regulator AlpA